MPERFGYSPDQTFPATHLPGHYGLVVQLAALRPDHPDRLATLALGSGLAQDQIARALAPFSQLVSLEDWDGDPETDALIMANGSVYSNANLITYQDNLGVDLEELRQGRVRVVDHGSGRGLFAREARNRGVDVFSINPKLHDEDRRKDFYCALGLADIDPEDVPTLHSTSLSHSLDLDDETATIVVSHYGLSYFTPKIPLEYGVASYTEVFRILQKGGKAYIGPYSDQDKLEYALIFLTMGGLIEFAEVEFFGNSSRIRISKP